jgi:hypothetical protein
MNRTHILKGVLGISGLIVLVIGLYINLNIVGFYASSGIEIPQSVGLFSELKSGATYLLFSGIFIVCGAVNNKFLMPAVALSQLLFWSFVIGRVMSVFLDGMPGSQIITALTIECMVGGAVLFAYIYYAKSHKTLI